MNPRDDANREICAFYKEEFLKHKALLEMQRELDKNKDWAETELALNRIISELDTVCHIEQFSQLASRLLKQIDMVTNLSASASCYPHRIH